MTRKTHTHTHTVKNEEAYNQNLFVEPFFLITHFDCASPNAPTEGRVERHAGVGLGKKALRILALAAFG